MDITFLDERAAYYFYIKCGSVHLNPIHILLPFCQTLFLSLSILVDASSLPFYILSSIKMVGSSMPLSRPYTVSCHTTCDMLLSCKHETMSTTQTHTAHTHRMIIKYAHINKIKHCCIFILSAASSQ